MLIFFLQISWEKIPQIWPTNRSHSANQKLFWLTGMLKYKQNELHLAWQFGETIW
jgi:hypothetical protein